MMTPGGHRMSVAMTNCGGFGWVTDRAGYRYDAIDPASGKPWPAMPSTFCLLAEAAAAEAGFDAFAPDACLVNRYAPGAKMSLHQDRDERDVGAPIVSVSLGLPAIFLFGGLKRSDKSLRYRRDVAAERADCLLEDACRTHVKTLMSPRSSASSAAGKRVGSLPMPMRRCWGAPK